MPAPNYPLLFKRLHTYFASLFLTLAAYNASATTIMQVDVDYLLQHAALVIEADVIQRQAKLHSNGRSIYTSITFRISDVIKGKYAQPTITLDYAGGTIGERGTAVAAMVYPSVGERGIYFIENPQRRLVNPLVGWGQGHFIVQRDSNGSDRLFTENKLPVLRVELPAPARASPGQQSAQPVDLLRRATAFSDGIAGGVHVGDRALTKSHAMDKNTFKRALRQRLNQQ